MTFISAACLPCVLKQHKHLNGFYCGIKLRRLRPVLLMSVSWHFFNPNQLMRNLLFFKKKWVCVSIVALQIVTCIGNYLSSEVYFLE
jgi:hypothetical protein